MILELFLWGRSRRQRAQIEELETRLQALEPPRPVAAKPPRSGEGGMVAVVLIIAVILIALAAGSNVESIPIPTPRPLP